MIVAKKILVVAWYTISETNLQTEQYTTNRRTEGNRNACGCCCWQHFSLPSFQSQFLMIIIIKPQSEILPSFPFILPKSFIKRLAQQQATCTKGPSLPSHIPDATARHYLDQRVSFGVDSLVRTSPIDLITNVQVPINRRRTKPPRTVLISGIPLCFA